jgi:hypothetical protein
MPVPAIRRILLLFGVSTVLLGGQTAALADNGHYDWAGFRLLSSGSRGGDVVGLQTALWGNGFTASRQLAIDGSFGSQTRATVVAFQQNRRINADGIVGPDTWRALEARLLVASTSGHPNWDLVYSSGSTVEYTSYDFSHYPGGACAWTDDTYLSANSYPASVFKLSSTGYYRYLSSFLKLDPSTSDYLCGRGN